MGLSTENPPQTQITISVPKKGIVANKLVITVAPQKDICPQGNTYPINAVAIELNNIKTPRIQVIVKL